MSAQIAPGTVLADKFRVERVLGQGNMGVVLLATHLQLEQQVALKFLLPSAVAQVEQQARFAQEARAAAKIKSEHVARVIDVSALETGAPYIVMEYLEGTDLSKYLRKHGPLPSGQAVAYMLQACEALAEAHAAGIVHRDLKLSNLFVARYPEGTPCIKILDFGISKLISSGADPDLGLTGTTAVMGSPLYMSPEQMRSARNVDVRSDIWSLGVMLYELVSGRVPFEAQTMPQLCTMILQDEPPPLASFCPNLPRGFEAVVRRCLEKDRARRYPNVHAVSLALAEYAPAEAKRSIERISRLASGPPSSVGSSPTLQRGHASAEPAGFAGTVSPRPRHWKLPAALALGGFAVIVAWRWLLPAPAPAVTAPAAATAAAPATVTAAATPVAAAVPAPTPAAAPAPVAAPAAEEAALAPSGAAASPEGLGQPAPRSPAQTSRPRNDAPSTAARTKPTPRSTTPRARRIEPPVAVPQPAPASKKPSPLDGRL